MVERGEKQHPQPPKALGTELWYPFDKQRGALITKFCLPLSPVYFDQYHDRMDQPTLYAALTGYAFLASYTIFLS